MPDLIPAPGSTATVAPSPIIFLTVSGVAATRDSPASVSAITATFMDPPTARLGLAPLPVHATGNVIRSRQEKCHQDEDDNDDRQRDLHQGHEVAIGMFVSGIIIARCGRIFDFGVLGHYISPNGSVSFEHD